MDKRARAALFRERLALALGRAGLSRAGLARAIGADRSTVTQMLGEGASVPGAHLAAECAEALGVTADWLLGLTDTPQSAAEMLGASLQIADAERTPTDAKLLEWFAEARGAKVRHVPTSLPDMMKTEHVLEWEYERALVRTGAQAVTMMRDRLDLLRDPDHEFEIAVAADEVLGFAQGAGYWHGLEGRARIEQLVRMADLADELYPSLRLYLYDARRLYSAPLTVFGRGLAVLYVGQIYTVFRRTVQVRALIGHFDELVREASVDARGAGGRLREMAAAIGER